MAEPSGGDPFRRLRDEAARTTSGPRLQAMVEAALAGNEDLAGRPIGQLLQAAAGNPRAPAALLDRLSRESDPAVRLAVARHPAAPTDALVRLGWCDDEAVVEAVLERRELPPRVWRVLADARSPRLRLRLALHPEVPVQVLIDLANEGSGEIAAQAFMSPRMGDLGRRLFHAATDPRSSVDRLSALFARGGRLQRLAVLHRHCPVEVLVSLCDEAESELRAIVASHPRTPERVALRLLGDPAPTVRASAERRWSLRESLAEAREATTPPDRLEALAAEVTRDRYWRRCHWARLVAAALARHARAPAALRARLEDEGVAGALVVVLLREASAAAVAAAAERARGVVEVRGGAGGPLAVGRFAAAEDALEAMSDPTWSEIHAMARGVGVHAPPAASAGRGGEAAALEHAVRLAQSGSPGLVVTDVAGLAARGAFGAPAPFLPWARRGWTEAVLTWSIARVE